MFSIAVNNPSVFASFLSSADLDYVDVYLHDEVATLVLNNSDFFSVVILDCTHTPDEKSRSFRMPRELLKQQKRANTISIRIDDDAGLVHSFFMCDSTLLCGADFILQKAYSINYDNKLQIFRKASRPYCLKLEMIAPLIKLCLTLGGVINVESGVACAIFKNGVRIYKKINYDECLCMSPKNAQILRTCDNSIFSIENYIGAFKDNFAILVNKVRVASNAQFHSLGSVRSQYVADIDFSNLVSFACSHAVKTPSFIIDLDNRHCKFSEKAIEYTIQLAISDEIRAKKDVFHALEVPFSIVRNVLPELGTTQVHVVKKQFFIQFDINDFTIIYN